MAQTFTVPDWQTYRMDILQPHEALEPLADETKIVDQALALLVQENILPTAAYDQERFLAHRKAVQELFEIPWTAITPRMQRLLFAINAIVKPQHMLAAGIYCGNTFISNAGAAVGPGAVYSAEALVGVEINAESAELAERNVRRIDSTGVARIIAADAIDVARDYKHPLDLLYLDADGIGGRGKGIYLDILQAARPHLSPGAIILAHNSVNCAPKLSEYLAHVRDAANCTASVNIILDGEGLEVTRL